MKLRITDNSVRFRITEQELEQLNTVGDVEAHTDVIEQEDGPITARLNYGVVSVHKDEPSRCEMHPNSIFLYINGTDLKSLNESEGKAFQIRRETSRMGKPQRFLAYVEMDLAEKRGERPAPEDWLHETPEAPEQEQT